MKFIRCKYERARLQSDVIKEDVDQIQLDFFTSKAEAAAEIQKSKDGNIDAASSTQTERFNISVQQDDRGEEEEFY